MSENIKLEMISRRKVFSVLGLAAAASLAIPATVLTVTNADAQAQGIGDETTDVTAVRIGATTGVTRKRKKSN